MIVTEYKKEDIERMNNIVLGLAKDLVKSHSARLKKLVHQTKENKKKQTN